MSINFWTGLKIADSPNNVNKLRVTGSLTTTSWSKMSVSYHRQEEVVQVSVFQSRLKPGRHPAELEKEQNCRSRTILPDRISETSAKAWNRLSLTKSDWVTSSMMGNTTGNSDIWYLQSGWLAYSELVFYWFLHSWWHWFDLWTWICVCLCLSDCELHHCGTIKECLIYSSIYHLHIRPMC